ncbi:MAG: pyridoxal phosphate-dependent transferase [Olpidium bornovanus]|uniref:histidinol-phosphate transaminase n=1 Tax=Olpidium bornovanus TaxID=278681 RepID=A0A8H8DH75_9FUNG|nr:MAG: pyridoxal phosphate-dependent transferase [Olpidium bornovanus]
MYQVCAQTNDVGVRKVPLNVKDGRFQLRVDELGKYLRYRLGVVDGGVQVKRALSADPDVKILFLCSPGNPTGSLLDPQDVKALLEYRSYRGLIVVDEAYIDFAETVDGQNPSAATWVMDYPNLLVSQTLSKSFGLAAIRFGVGIAQPALIQYLSKAKAPYNLSTPTLSIAEEALSAEGVEAMRRNVAVLVSDRRRLIEALRAMPRIGKILGLCDANFVLAEVLDRDGNPSNAAAQAVYEALAKDRGVVVRFRGNEPGCFACLRITVGTAEEIGVLLRELTKIFERAEV